MTEAEKPLFTLEQFKAMTGATPDKAKLHYLHAINALKNFGITSKAEIAAILATANIESAKLESMKEDLYYRDAERLAGLFKRVFDTNGDKKISPDEVAYAQQFVQNSAALNQKLYDGFCGRGPGQLTWRGNYVTAGNLIGVDLANQPALVEQPSWGWMAFVAFWVSLGMGAKAADAKATRRAWNGPAMLKLDEYTAAYNAALKVLG